MPKLDTAIAEATGLVPEAKGELAKVEGANAVLVRLEDEAFESVRQKRLDKAWALLNREEYQRNKSEYAKGWPRLSNRLKYAIRTGGLRPQAAKRCGS